MGIQKKYWFLLLLVIIIFTTLISQCTSFPYAEDLLTPEEEQWLSEHDGTIVLAPEKNYPPLSYVDEEGARRGISAEYIRFIEERLDFSFAVAPPDNLAAILNNAGARDVDVIRSLKKTPERSETLLFTEPYIEIPTVIIVRKNIKGSLGLEDFRGKRVAVGEGCLVVLNVCGEDRG